MKPFDLKSLPDFSRRSVVDDTMSRLDTHGVSRRQFLAMASAGAVASVAAAAAGLPSIAIAAPSGKLGYLAWSASTEYNQLVSQGAKAAAQEFGINYAFFDGQISSERQVNQFESLTTEHATGGFFNILDGSSLKRVSQLADHSKTYFGAVWALLDWFTPYSAGEYFTLFAVPEEDVAHQGASAALYQAVTDKFGGGKVAALTGTPGNWCETARNRGRNAALAHYPKVKEVATLPGKWLREDSLRATQDLLTRYPDLVGIVTQNDDEAQGAIAAIKQAGLKPGVDVLVSGADGTSLGAQAVAKGEQVSTSGNSPVYTGALFTSRIYDVTHGWTPKAAERMQYWSATVVTKKNVQPYLDRYVDNRGVEPFNYRKLSRVLSPKDWDPQANVFPIDIDHHWKESPKPAGFTYPKAYQDAKQSGEWERVKAEYAEHYKIKFDGPSPNRKA